MSSPLPSLKSIDSLLAQVQKSGLGSGLALGPNAASVGKSPAGGDFGSVLGQALQQVSQAGDQAAALQKRFQLEDPNVSLEETMVAGSKAQVGFQAAVQVRNRLVQAYTDIMNMPV